jgi:5-methylcytosine-specific restriction enzyme A
MIGGMSTTRKTATYTKQQARGTNGRGACLWCDGDILDATRSTFCGKQCAEEFYIRSRPNHARLRVFERDRGVCAICHINVFAGTGRTPRSRGTGDLWQADHINAVIEGGGECGLDNLRTLCTKCHLSVTNELRTRLRSPAVGEGK